MLDDVRHAFRSLLRSPAFTLAAVLTLALGIGANSSIFSVINAVLLRPLPYERPEDLVRVFETFPNENRDRFSSSPGEFLAWRERNEVFARVSAYHVMPANLTGGGTPEQIPCARVSADYFDVLGVKPLHGRLFVKGEDEEGRADVAVLSHELFKRRFGADPAVVGRTILVDGRAVAVVGVVKEGERLPQGSDIAVPIPFKPEDQKDRGHHFMDVVARLKPGIGLRQAQAGMDTLAKALDEEAKGSSPHGVLLSSMHEMIVGESRPALRLLLGAVGFVLLIACANVAGLLLSRAAARQRDLSIRAALGASRGRLVGHLMAEGLVLAVLGGALGLLMAVWGVELLPRLLKDALPPTTGIDLDRTVLLFTTVVVMLSGILVGLFPALHFGKALPQLALQAGGRGSTESRQRQRLRSLLVGSEIALTIVLLVGASLLMRSFVRLRSLDPGFQSERRIIADVFLPATKYPDPPRVTAFYDALTTRLASLPGVEAVGVVNVLPLSGSNTSGNYSLEGEDEKISDARPNADRRSVSPDYFRAFGIHIVKGRAFTAHDTKDSQPVAIVNETLARQRFKDGDALGKRIRSGSGNTNKNPWMEIVGIVQDVRHEALERAPREEMYLPASQKPSVEMTLVVSARGDTRALTSSLSSAVLAIDPDQPLAHIRPMDELVDESLAPRRAALTLLAAFALIAVLLAAVGLYGLIAYSVAQRTREIGVRMALGARAADVLLMVLRQAMTLAGAGVAAGLVIAFLLARVMTSLLFGVGAADPLTFAVVPLLLAAVAGLASLLPARRATRVDPMTALRAE